MNTTKLYAIVLTQYETSSVKCHLQGPTYIWSNKDWLGNSLNELIQMQSLTASLIISDHSVWTEYVFFPKVTCFWACAFKITKLKSVSNFPVLNSRNYRAIESQQQLHLLHDTHIALIESERNLNHERAVCHN